MKKIKRFVHMLDDEIESAERYAEKYIESKAEGDTSLAQKYREAAAQEISHADFIHEVAVREIDKISAVYPAPPEMKEAWKESHNNYVTKVNSIKAMLNM